MPPGYCCFRWIVFFLKSWDITLCFFPYIKCSCRVYEEDIKQVSSGSNDHDIFLVIFAGIVLQLVKVVVTISAFNPCPSLTSVPRCKRRQESVSLRKNYKTGPLFLDAKKSLSFFKREQITWHSPLKYYTKPTINIPILISAIRYLRKPLIIQ